MARPGLDLVVYALAPILGIGLLAKSMIRKRKANEKKEFWLVLVNLVGLTVIALLVIFEMTKQG